MFDYFSIRLDTKATGARIKQLRTEKHIKVSELAEMLGSSENAIFKWQRGDSVPTIDNLIILSVIFETPIDDIIQKEEAGEPLLPFYILYYDT
ncbi:MAG: helix-turn-helix transcriptional regulator [Butyrivibrio sp.]|nr:helix-turn-helix transcriptional regulator [Butyrivibrio sp.]